MTRDVVDADEALKRDTEKWFVRRGLPHFIDRYNATEDIFTRAAPFLSVAFVFYMIPYLDTTAEDRAGWAQLLSVVLVVIIGVAGLGIVNRIRGRKFLSRPRRIGWPEIIGFLAIPTVTHTVTGIHWYDGINTLLTLLVVLGLTYVVTSYGLVPMTRWAVGQMFTQFRRARHGGTGGGRSAGGVRHSTGGAIGGRGGWSERADRQRDGRYRGWGSRR